MNRPPTPSDEPSRLASLNALEILYTPAEERFDRITRLATRLLDVPIALLSLVDGRVQWFKSSQGLNLETTPRAESFCAYTVLSDSPFVISDTHLDDRFRDIPLVTGEPFLRSYAGQPLHGADGQRVGSLCVMDRRPRAFSQTDLDLLRDLGLWAEAELRTDAPSTTQRQLIADVEPPERLSLLDHFTRSWNRAAIDDILARELARADRGGVPMGIAMLAIENLGEIADIHGAPAAEMVLLESARRIRAVVRSHDALGRYGGDEFLLVLSCCSRVETALVAERAVEALRADPMKLPDGSSVLVNAIVGVTSGVPRGHDGELGVWIDLADQALYRARSRATAWARVTPLATAA